MRDENEELSEYCMNLVAQRATQGFPMRLFDSIKRGEWASVNEICRVAGIEGIASAPDLVATWLAEPSGDPSFSVILFFDAESLLTFAAVYNKERLYDNESRSSEP